MRPYTICPLRGKIKIDFKKNSSMRAESLQFCLTLCDAMDCSLPGSSVHGFLQARILEWVAMPSSRDLPDPGIELASHISPALASGFFTIRATWKEALGLQGDPTCPTERRSVLGAHWKDRCWSWNSNTLATWYEELTHLKRPWCWERLRAGGEGDDRGWDGWMASLTQWTWVWVNSGSWWWTGRPGVLWFMGSLRDRHDWATELNWTELRRPFKIVEQELNDCVYGRSLQRLEKGSIHCSRHCERQASS